MNNPFVQHIGIWYAKEDELIMMRIMDQISEWCSYCIEKEIHSKYGRSIYLKDGTWIKAIPLNENMRGQRCTSSFVINPEHTTDKFIEKVIYPITTIGSGGVFVIDSSDDEELWYSLWHRMTYRNWYTKHEATIIKKEAMPLFRSQKEIEDYWEECEKARTAFSTSEIERMKKMCNGEE